MIFNFFFLKKKNGLFYYGLDYLNSFAGERIVIIKAGGELSKSDFPKCSSVVALSNLFDLLIFILKSRKPIEALFTPSPHPIPFIRQQIVIFHDEFPFFGFLGIVKRILFYFAQRASGCYVGFINFSSALPFLKNKLFVRQRDLVYAPNLPIKGEPDTLKRIAGRSDCDKLYDLGCFGTDSWKKDYHSLMQAFETRCYPVRLNVYGVESEYLCCLKDKWKEKIRFFDSSTYDLNNFITQIDCCVSIAKNEGYGRPIALCLSYGVPTYLLESPAFVEFYFGRAVMGKSIDEVVENIIQGYKLKFETTLGQDRSYEFLNLSSLLSDLESAQKNSPISR